MDTGVKDGVMDLDQLTTRLRRIFRWSSCLKAVERFEQMPKLCSHDYLSKILHRLWIHLDARSVAYLRRAAKLGENYIAHELCFFSTRKKHCFFCTIGTLRRLFGCRRIWIYWAHKIKSVPLRVCQYRVLSTCATVQATKKGNGTIPCPESCVDKMLKRRAWRDYGA